MTKQYPGIVGSGDLHITVLQAICGDVHDKSLIDLCCGGAPTTRHLGFGWRTYVDVIERDLQDENVNRVIMDVFEYLRYCNPADVSIILDGIEHFRFDKGRELIALMESKSRKQIIFTPLGEYMTNSDPLDNHPDTHKAGWLPEMLPGYATLVFPDFHPTLGNGGLGAFYAWKCDDITQDFERVVSLLGTMC